MLKREILSLTGLRGVAAFMVILYHFGQPTTEFGIPREFHVPKGYVAVDTFFMLSGFVLSFNYANLFRSGMAPGVYADFLVKRVARVYPAYLGVGVLYLARLLFNLSGDRAIDSFTWYDGIANLFCATGWGLSVKPLIQDSWSVSAEILCYFMFPLLAAIVFSNRWISAALSALVALTGFFLIERSGIGAKGWLDAVASDSFYPLVRAFSGFTLGMVIFAIFALSNKTLSKFSDAITALSVAALLASCIVGNDWLIVFCIFFLVLGLSFDGAIAKALFANRLTMFLGRISYSLYLVHVILISVAVRLSLKLRFLMSNDGELYWVALTAFVILCLIVATASYEIFEKRGRKAFLSMYAYVNRESIKAQTN